jgi:hypothetical protein
MGGAGMTPAEGGMLLLCMLALAGSTAYMSASLKQARHNQRRAEKMLHELDAKFRNHMKQHERSIRRGSRSWSGPTAPSPAPWKTCRFGRRAARRSRRSAA